MISLEYFSNFSLKSFKNIYSSDLLRAKQTFELSTAFEESRLLTSKNLREIYYGKNEGLYYDGLSDDQKKEMNSPYFNFPEGESWVDLKYRVLSFLIQEDKKENLNGLNLMVTHGGLILNLLNQSGLNIIPKPGSVIGVELSSASEGSQKENEEILIEYKKIYKAYSEELSEAQKSEHRSKLETFHSTINLSLTKYIKSIEFISELPDIQEEFL